MAYNRNYKRGGSKDEPRQSAVLPHNQEAEQALLGCMLIDNDILADTLEGLSENDFYNEAHRNILSAVKTAFSSHKPVDVVTLSDVLENDGNLEKSGGISYLTELTQATPSAANYKYYLDIVKRDSVNRKLIRAAEQIADYCRSSDDVVKSVQYAEQNIYDISRTNDSSTVKDIRESDAVQAVLDRFQIIAKDKDSLRGVPTGFHRLDKLTNGLQKSDLIILAARPGVGKTSFAMNIVEHAALAGKVCAVFSLEMPEIQIVQRLMCSNAEVSMADALSGKLEQNDWAKLFAAGDRIKQCRINIDDSSRVTPAEILSKCRRIKSRNDGALDLVVIDYIQLMSSGKRNEENRVLEIASITRDLKIMAKELDVPVLALSQLRRIQSNEPQLSDLRESGAIEQDADMVMFITRLEGKSQDTDEEGVKKVYPKGLMELVIAKHRNGALDRIKLRFKGELTKFVNFETNEEFTERAQNSGSRREKAGGQPSEQEEEYVPYSDSDAPPEDEDPPF